MQLKSVSCCSAQKLKDLKVAAKQGSEECREEFE
jgi:hypothetical protein